MDERTGPPRATSCLTCRSCGETEWSSLDKEGLDLLNQVKVSNTYQPGQVIFYQGNPCLGLYCIESGAVAVRMTDPHGNSAIVRMACSGETLGYRAYFAGQPYHASADALTPTRVCFIDRSAVRHLLDHNPMVGMAFLKRMAEDLEDAEEAKLHSMSLSVRARVAHLLLVLKERFGTVGADGTLVIELPLSRQDMAAMVGTRPETIARAVRSLEAQNVAHFTGRQVVVPDLDALLDLIEVQV
ncbi:MAG: Crp/Fnr family transcriptional regulator [Myxococcota bacterium]